MNNYRVVLSWEYAELTRHFSFGLKMFCCVMRCHRCTMTCGNLCYLCSDTECTRTHSGILCNQKGCWVNCSRAEMKMSLAVNLLLCTNKCLKKTTDCGSFFGFWFISRWTCLINMVREELFCFACTSLLSRTNTNIKILTLKPSSSALNKFFW